MTAYLIRRLLWMIPTFVGILLITFGVLRLQGPSLDTAMATQGDERAARTAATGVENHLAKLRTTGNDLPALVNLRGFSDKADAVAWLRATSRQAAASEHGRNRTEKDLWMAGHFLVAPLAAVVADDALAELHGPASMALSLCAYMPLNQDELDRLTDEQQRHRQARNAGLKDLRIAYTNERGVGFVTTDPAVAAKRMRIAAFLAAEPEFQPSAGRAWGAVLAETGFTDFMGKLFTGRLYSTDRKAYVFDLIADRWNQTFALNLAATIIGWLGSIAIGLRSAVRRGTLEDRGTTGALFALWSLPSFFVGTLLLHHFCTDQPGSPAWFPNRGLSSPDSMWMSTLGYLGDLVWHAALPLLVLCYGSFTELSRYLRGNVIDQLSSDYIRTGRAKGLDEGALLWRHAVPNSLITMITLGSGLLASLFGSSVVVEYIFSIQGLGSLLVDAARAQDAPLVMGSTIISVGLLLISILIADILYAVADPRIRSRYG